MGNVLVGSNNNIYTATLDVTAKTLTIKNVVAFSLNLNNLVSVWNTTRSAAFPAPSSFTFNNVSGLVEYVWTFASLPAASANGDTLLVIISIPDQFMDYSILQVIATATV